MNWHPRKIRWVPLSIGFGRAMKCMISSDLVGHSIQCPAQISLLSERVICIDTCDYIDSLRNSPLDNITILLSPYTICQCNSNTPNAGGLCARASKEGLFISPVISPNLRENDVSNLDKTVMWIVDWCTEQFYPVCMRWIICHRS